MDTGNVLVDFNYENYFQEQTEQEYQQLNPVLKQQLKQLQKLHHTLIGDDDLSIGPDGNYVPNSHLMRSSDSLMQMLLLKSLRAFYLLDQKMLPYAVCYHSDPTMPKIMLNGVLNRSMRYVILSAKMGHQDVTVKCYQSGNKSSSLELSVYQRLMESGCSSPRFWSGYYIWNCPVFVLEVLFSLTTEDDPFQVGAAVLEQLAHLHKFAVHNNIKPSVIKKKNGKYYLTHYNNPALERLEYGYERGTWTAYYSSQQTGQTDQVTTAVNDLIELGYTMQELLLRKQKEDNEQKDIRSGFKGPLQKYMQRVQDLDPKNIPNGIHSELIAILNGS